MAVISQRLAQRLFGDAPLAVGRALALSGQAYTVVGVAAPDFRLPDARTDVWTPLGQARDSDLAPWLKWPRGGGVSFVARLRPGVTAAEARADLDRLGQELAQERPEVARGRFCTVTPVLDSVAGSVRPALRLLFGAVVLVLLVAAANVTNLLLARHAARERDLALRVALGASRGRLVRHALAESAVLGLGGGLGGLLLALGLVRALLWLEPAQLPRLDSIRVDGPTLAFALAVAALTTLAAGLGPAWRASRRDAAPLLALAGAARLAGSARAGRLRSSLVVAQVAAAAVLLVGSSLLARSFVHLLDVEIGARTDGVLVARLDLSLGRQLTEPQERALGAALVERVQAIPGVRGAGLGASLPPNGRMAEVTLKDLPTARGVVPEYAVNAAPVTAGFFPTLGIPLLRGRLFAPADDADRPPVTILSADAAEDLFGDDPLGRTLPLPTRQGGSAAATVIGVVGNVKYKGLANPVVPTVYVPFAQQPWPQAFLVARSTGATDALVPELRRAIAEVDRGSAVSSLESLDAIRAREAAPPGFRAALVGVIAVLAVTLAAVGLSGVVGYTVSRRTAEIGVRMALGAARRDVLVMVLREGTWVGASGVALGLAAAFALRGALRGFVFGVTASDPWSFAGAPVFLFLLVLLASYVPARRASRIDPTVALRAE
jgi:putative ABC transport system permease protein